MIHFAYPNVGTVKVDGKIAKKFSGCGRYVALSQKEPPKSYQAAKPKVLLNRTKIYQSVATLAPESAHKKAERYYVYEKKDDREEEYSGDSQDLAYLLSLINRFREITLQTDSDIWCTGSMDVTGDNSPFLNAVIDSAFDIKLKAFLSEKENENNDKLFIVPAANIRVEDEILCREKNAEVLSLNQFEFSDRKKTILKIHGSELVLLAEKIFDPPPLPIKQTFVMTLGITLIMLLLCWLQFFDFFHIDTTLERYTIGAGDRFVEKTFNDDKIALVAIEDEEFDETWREKHAMLIDKLSKAGAKVILFDMYFENASRFDKNFTHAITVAKKRGTEVVIGLFDLKGGKPRIFQNLKEVVGENYGTICVNEKEFYAIKAPLLLRKENGDRFASLSLKAVSLFYSQDIVREYGHDEIILKNFAEGAEMEMTYADVPFSMDSCPIIQDGDSVASIYVDLSPHGLLKEPGLRFKYQDVIASVRKSRLKEDFGDKIVLVGAQIRDRDCLRVPRGLQMEDCCFGMELHADTINTLLNGIHIRPSGLQIQAVFIFLFAMVGVFVKWKLELSFQANLILLLLTLIGITIFFYCQYRILLHSAYYAAAFAWTHSNTFRTKTK